MQIVLYIIKNTNIYEKIVKNDEKVLEIISDLLYNKHWACKNALLNCKIKKT